MGRLESARRCTAHRPRRTTRHHLRRETGIAGARPAVKGGLEFAPFLAERGRAFPGGHCASVGLGGFLLQGGQGWDSRHRGWACQSVIGLDVVTADGDLIHVDDNENSDLLWAARGAGPGFPGVITRFYLQTYEQSPAMWQDTWTFALADTADLLSWMHDLLPQIDDRVEPVIAATRLPDVPLYDGVARPDEAVLLLHTTVMADSDEEVLELLAPFDAGPLVGRELGHVRGRTTVLEENEAQRRRTPKTIVMPSTAPGLTRPRTNSRHCFTSCGANSRLSTRSRSGTAGHLRAIARTWRSRSRPMSTSPHT